MEFKQLEIYVKVCELKSFSKTAEEIFLSQPSVSAHISALEKELNSQLIHRSNKEFLPTKAGKLFLQQAKEMLAARDRAIKKIKSLSDSTGGTIDILASSVPAQYILPKLLGAFHKIYPNINFNIRQTDTQKVVEGIAANECDIGFVGSKIDSSNKCIYEDLVSEKLILIAPNEQRFRNIQSGDLAGLLRNEFFVMRESGSGTRQEYEEFLRGLGITVDELKISAHFNNTQSIIEAVAGGLGLSIISELAAEGHLRAKAITQIPIENPPRRHFYIALRKNLDPTTPSSSFINFTKSFNFNTNVDPFK